MKRITSLLGSYSSWRFTAGVAGLGLAVALVGGTSVSAAA